MRTTLYSAFAFLVFVLVPVGLHAQSFQGKLIIGINGSQIDNDGIAGFNQGGILAGVGVSYPLSEKTSLESQACFSMKGSKSTDQQPYIRYRTNFIEIPLMLSYEIKDDIHVRGGLSGNYVINARAENAAGLNTNHHKDISTVDWCAFVGAGYQLNSSWMARIHFNSSIISMRRDMAHYNRSLSFAMVYTFNS